MLADLRCCNTAWLPHALVQRTDSRRSLEASTLRNVNYPHSRRARTAGHIFTSSLACGVFAFSTRVLRPWYEKTVQLRAIPHRPRVQPGKISKILSVPPEILRPPYLQPGAEFDPDDGMPLHEFLYEVEIKNARQIEAMRTAGGLARAALEEAGRMVAPGVTPDEIDKAVHEFIVAQGVYPSPLGYLGFPKSVSTSVNDIIAHGIPDDRPLEDGDILNVDITVFADGHHGDTSSMFLVGSPDRGALKLCDAAQRAMMAGIQVCGPGVDFREIGTQIERVATEAYCYISPYFVGHGIGNYFHGSPEVVPCTNTQDQGVMKPGMTFTVEPILIENYDDSYEPWDDNWTVQTATGSRSAQFEHTVLITEGGYELLTGPSIDYVALAAQVSERCRT